MLLITNPRDDWHIRHNAAVRAPRVPERAVVDLCHAIDTVCATYADETADYLLRDDVLLPIFQAAQSLLNWDLGRLDGGTVSAWLDTRAESVGISLDLGTVVDGGSDEDEDAGPYVILRMRFKGETTIVATGLTLDEAREHCQREDTRGDGWFDGYETQTPGLLSSYMLDTDYEDAAR